MEVVFESFEAGGSDLFNSVSRKCGMVMKAYNTLFLSISMREACAQGREMTTIIVSVCVMQSRPSGSRVTCDTILNIVNMGG